MVNSNNNNENSQQRVVEYAEWQKTEDEYGNHYVVYQAGGLGGIYYVVELDEYLISKVVGPIKEDGMTTVAVETIDLDDPEQLRRGFGCYTCDGPEEAWNSFEETCRHREAVITVLKRRRDSNNNNIGREKEGATTITEEEEDGWVITFTERRPQKEKELKAV